MCQHRLSIITNIPLWDAGSKGAGHVGTQGIWELGTFCSIFLWIETTLKGKVYFKKKCHERQRQKPSLKKKKLKIPAAKKITVTKGTKEYIKQKNVQSFKETFLRQYCRYEKSGMKS